MIKLKNKLYLIILILLSINCFCQKFKYDLDKNGIEDSVKIDTENYIINIDLNKSKSSFEIPEITSYEKISLNKFDSGFINIHYSSSVSSIDLFVKFKNRKWILTNTLFYSPCQTCEDGEIKTCESSVNIEINKLTDENIESLVFNNINCRKLYYNDKNLSVIDLNKYANKIVLKEYILDETIINKTLEKYPINKKNIGMYKNIRKNLDKIKLSVENLDKNILIFAKKNKRTSKK
jgi:hypothetical protein